MFSGAHQLGVFLALGSKTCRVWGWPAVYVRACVSVLVSQKPQE